MLVAIDFETELISATRPAPRPVCLSLAWDGEACPVPASAGFFSVSQQACVLPTSCIEAALHALFAGEHTLVAHNGAGFEAPVILAWTELGALLFDALDANRFLDTIMVERIAEISGFTSRKRLDFATVCKSHGIPEPSKDPAVRLSFGPLLGQQIEAYSDAQIQYSLTDAVGLLELCKRQQSRWGTRIALADIAYLTRKMFAHSLTNAWGLLPDPARVEELVALTDSHVLELRAECQAAGLIRTDQSKDMRAIRALVSDAYLGKPPMTVKPKGWMPSKRSPCFTPQVSTARDTLEEAEHPLLEHFAEYQNWASMAIIKGKPGKDRKILTSTEPIHSKLSVLNTLRLGMSAPNQQNFPRLAPGDRAARRRKEKANEKWEPSARGIRECFVPQLPGHVFVGADYGMLEICTLAQVSIHYLRMWGLADKINAGMDLHLELGAAILRTTYGQADKHDPTVKNARNCAKPVNFGCPGGMTAPTMRHHAKLSYGIDRDVKFWADVISLWKIVTPEGPRYLEYVRRAFQRGDLFAAPIPGTEVIRANCTYCAACNTGFQGLGAVLAGHAAYEIAREQFTQCTRAGKRSPLRWLHPAVFAHDEVIGETPINARTEVALRLAEVMVEASKPYIPDVLIKVEPVAMRRWSKLAESAFDSHGELVIWDA